MKSRGAVIVPGLAVLLCAAITLYQLFQIDETLRQVQEDGAREFNFIQHTDHDFDSLAYALSDYINSVDEYERETLKNRYINRFEVISDTFRSTEDSHLGELAGQPGTEALLQDVIKFLDKYEESITRIIDPNEKLIWSMIVESRELSARTFDLGSHVFEHKSLLRDELASRVGAHRRWLRIGTVMLAITTLLTALLLLALLKRMSNALDDVSTGDRERKALNSFVAAASHDLRQPLHALGLYLGALKSHVSSPQGKAILENSFRSTEALNHLLNSMLDLSKLDAGVVEINLEHIKLNDIFDRLHQTYSPDAKERDLRLMVRHTNLVVHTDPLLLERILGNLLSNALTYTQDGSVCVSASLVDDLVQISVSDTGPGIPENEHQQIYEEFYQLDNPERDRTKGLGLGLSIVKRLTRLLDITLDLKSEPNMGTTFNLALRAGELKQIPQQPRSTNNAIDTDLDGLSILVIDDEADVREGMVTLLEQHQCEVVSVDSAESALAYIIDCEWVPDLIIADYRLRDEKKGDVAIQQVREEVNADVPAMIITGDTSPARLKEAKASGFALLHKPVMANALIDNITKLNGEYA